MGRKIRQGRNGVRLGRKTRQMKITDRRKEFIVRQMAKFPVISVKKCFQTMMG